MNELKSATESEIPAIDQVDATDAQLLSRYVGLRDPLAFEALLLRHGPMVFGICRRILTRHHEAEDAFQNTFLSLAKNAAQIAKPEMLAGWLYGVARHAALKVKKTASNRQHLEQRLDEQMDAITESMSNREELWSDLAPVIDTEIERLAEHLRITVVLCDIEGKTRKEAARQLGWPEATVSTRLMKARSLLAKRLTRHGVVISSVTLGVVLTQNVATAAVPGTLVASTLTSASTVVVVQSTWTAAAFSKAIAFIKSLCQPITLTLALLVGIAAIIFLPGGPAQQTEPKKVDDLLHAGMLSLGEIQQGIETTFDYLRNHCVALDYRVDFEYAADLNLNDVGNPKWSPVPSDLRPEWQWQEQKIFLEESKMRLSTSMTGERRGSDGSVEDRAITIDGKTIRWHDGSRWILVGDVQGFPTGPVHTIGAFNFRHRSMDDRYFKNIGYILTNPYDRAFNVEYEPTDRRFIPNCFKKAKYMVVPKQEKIDGDLCQIIEAPGVDQMWIDMAHGYLVRKRQFKWRDWRDGKPRVWVQITNSDLEKVAEGIWLPRRSVVERFVEEKPGSKLMGERIQRETLVAKSVAVRGPMPDRQYCLEIPAGTEIIDERFGRVAERFAMKFDNPQFDDSGQLVPAVAASSTSSPTSATGSAVAAAIDVRTESHESQPVWGTHRPIELPRIAWQVSTWMKLFVGVNIVMLLGIAGYFAVRCRLPL